MNSQTAVLYPAKEKLIDGPSLPSIFQDLHANTICSISLNKTHLIIMGHHGLITNSDWRYKMAMIDFQRQEWFSLTDFDLDFSLASCKGALGFEKNGKRLVVYSNIIIQ